MKVVVGYDGSNVAKDALQLVFKRAKMYDAEIDIVQAVLQSHTLKYEEIRRLELTLENEVKAIAGDLKNYETHVLVTHQTSGEALVEFAKDHKADEVIIGVRRRSKVSKLVFGSTAQFVILNSPCPVLSIQ